MFKYLWVDVETTGTDPKLHTVHQVAGQIVIDGIIIDKFNLEFRPAEGAEINDKALEVSDLTREQILLRTISSEEAYEQFNNILTSHVDKYSKKDKYIFCAYNAKFDADFLSEWYKRNGNKYFFGLILGGAYLDPLNLSLLYEIKKGEMIFDNHKLGTVAKYFGIELDNAHDALADIVATRKVASRLFHVLFSPDKK